MTFSERLKRIREQKELTQEQLAQRSGISRRMIQKYESGVARPRFDASEKIASALEISVSELLGESGTLVTQAAEKYGSRGAKQAEELMSEVTGLFAGGDLAEEDMDVMMRAITEAYWIAKEKNKKYTPKRYTEQG